MLPLNKAKKLIAVTLAAGIVPMMHGSPAIGKSSVAAEIAEKSNLLLLDERLTAYDAAEMNGLLNFNSDRSRSQFIPMENFPLEGDELPINAATGKPYSGWLLLLDELPSASRAVMAAAYKLILDRKVGKHNLHSKCYMIAAGNLETDNAIVNSMGTALKSRMVNYYLVPELNSWKEIMSKQNRIEYRVSSFLSYKPDLFFNFSPETTEDTYGSPRTWEMLSKQLAKLPKVGWEELGLVTGTVGVAAGREFVAFIEYFDKIPSIKEIVANPEGTRIPPELSFKYALAGMLGQFADKQNSVQVFKYLSRLDPEFQIVSVRIMVTNKKIDLDSSEMRKWQNDFANNLWG